MQLSLRSYLIENRFATNHIFKTWLCIPDFQVFPRHAAPVLKTALYNITRDFQGYTIYSSRLYRWPRGPAKLSSVVLSSSIRHPPSHRKSTGPRRNIWAPHGPIGPIGTIWVHMGIGSYIGTANLFVLSFNMSRVQFLHVWRCMLILSVLPHKQNHQIAIN